MALKKICYKSGCNVLVDIGNSYCENHKNTEAQRHKFYDKHFRNKDATAFYHSKDWLLVRKQALTRDYSLCQDCLDKKIFTPADMVHHILPLLPYWELRLDIINLRSLCNSCHSKIHATNNPAYPNDILLPNIPLVIVCGSAGSGKTTYVKENAKPNDIIIDLDDIKSQLSGLPWYQSGDEWLKPALYERNRRLNELSRESNKTAWFIVSAPKISDRRWWRTKLNPEKVIVLETPTHIIIERLKKDERRANQWRKFAEISRRWWSDYTPDADDVIEKRR